MYYPNKLYLLRGGRVLKIEAQTLGNLRYFKRDIDTSIGLKLSN